MISFPSIGVCTAAIGCAKSSRQIGDSHTWRCRLLQRKTEVRDSVASPTRIVTIALSRRGTRCRGARSCAEPPSYCFGLSSERVIALGAARRKFQHVGSWRISARAWSAGKRSMLRVCQKSVRVDVLIRINAQRAVLAP